MKSLLFTLFLINSIFASLPNDPQARSFRDGHNYFRFSTSPPARCMPLMAWDWSITTSANNYAQRCIWAHSGTPGYGENLYATSIRTPNASSYDPSGAVIAWGVERDFYQYSTNTCDPGKVCGHYTQMVWDTSNLLGCAFQDCPIIQNLPWPNGGTIAVCQYKAQGNVVGYRPYSAY